MSDLKKALQEVNDRISHACEKAGRKDKPTLMAVSKFQSLENVKNLHQLGQNDFGENYVQELIDKAKFLKMENFQKVRFHFIGHLQTNKIKSLLPHVFAIHSIDSMKLLDELQKQAERDKRQVQIYIQVNIDAEESKGGFSVKLLDEVAVKVQSSSSLKCLGLMCIPNPDLGTSDCFRRMKSLSQKYSKALGSGLSMGMSHDFESAIEAGATVVRVGTAIFGERKK